MGVRAMGARAMGARATGSERLGPSDDWVRATGSERRGGSERWGSERLWSERWGPSVMGVRACWGCKRRGPSDGGLMGARAVGVRVTEHDGRGHDDGRLDGDGNLQRHKRNQITGWRGAWVDGSMRA